MVRLMMTNKAMPTTVQSVPDSTKSRFAIIPASAQISTRLKKISRCLRNISSPMIPAMAITIMVQLDSLIPRWFQPVETSRTVTFAIVATVIQPK